MERMTWAVGMSWWMWVLMGLATIGFWVVVVLAVKDLLWSPSTDERPPVEDPLRLLDERFARGEIDAEQYMQAKRLLTHGR